MALTRKQQAFVTAYLDGGMSNASAAYRIAYPTSVTWTSQAVASAASEMLKHHKVVGILAAARDKAKKAIESSEDRYAVSKGRISRALSQMAFADSRKFYQWTETGVKLKSSDDLTDDEAAAVQAVTHTVTKDGGTIRVQLADKRQALMDLAKLHGYIVEKFDGKVEHAPPPDARAPLEQVLARAKGKAEPETRH